MIFRNRPLASRQNRRVNTMKIRSHISWLAIMTALTITAMGVRPGETQPADRRNQQRASRAQRPAARADADIEKVPGKAASSEAAKPPTENRLEVLSAAGGAKTIAMEFYGLDIDHLLRLLSYAAQVTIVKSDQVTGPITVIAPEPVPLDVAFQILDSILQVRGFTLVRAATGIYKVVPVAQAGGATSPLYFGRETGEMAAGDELITQVVPLENLSASDVASQIQELLSENASVIPTSTNSLIITDTASTIERVLTLIAHAETELAGGIKVYPLQYYDATEMSELITNIVLSRGGTAAGGARPVWERRVSGRGRPQTTRPTPRAQSTAGVATSGPEFAYPDTRTNSLIVLATPLHLQQIEELVFQLDRPVSLRDAYFVYPAQNLIASQLADSIAPLIDAEVIYTGVGPETGGGGRGGSSGSRTQTQGLTRPFTSTRTQSASSTGVGSSPISRGRNRSAYEVEPLAGTNAPLAIAQAQETGRPPARPEMPPPGEPIPSAGAGEDLETALTGAGVAQSTIVADDNTNTLLISAPPEQIDLIQQMLDKLDILPPQVHIRAIVAEVALQRDTSLGFQWENLGRTFGTFDGDVFTGNIGTNFGLTGPDDSNSPSGFFGTISGPEFDAILNVLTTDSKARILSAPSIFTASNQEAQIDISQQLPFPTGTFQSTTAEGTISTSISYRSVGIVLQVTPRVTQGDIVQMDIQIEANEPGSDVQVAGLAYPSFNQRLATATLNVRNGHTIVLGGLMREAITRSASRVPILGDLPIIGTLFRSTDSGRQKSELLLFLTPYVVRNPEEAADLTDREAHRLPDVPKSLRNPIPGEALEAPYEVVYPAEEAIEVPGIVDTHTELPEVDTPSPDVTPDESTALDEQKIPLAPIKEESPPPPVEPQHF